MSQHDINENRTCKCIHIMKKVSCAPALWRNFNDVRLPRQLSIFFQNPQPPKQALEAKFSKVRHQQAVFTLKLEESEEKCGKLLE